MNTTTSTSTPRKMAEATQDMVNAGAEHAERLLDAVPNALSQAAARFEDLARAGIDKARSGGHAVAHGAEAARHRTTEYVREEPGKALLIAAASGAIAALLVSWAVRSRNHHTH